MHQQKFLKCKHCGSLVDVIHNGGVPILCCGGPMEELCPNTVEAATEKHIPEVSRNGRLVHVKVGSVPHPMVEEHHISFLYLQTESGGQMRRLQAGEGAQGMFAVLEEEPLAAFAYCNLHGLWKTDISCACKDTPVETESTDETVCSADFTQGCI